jgi:DNA uptake protein ComE-like DNA-binding protein
MKLKMIVLAAALVASAGANAALTISGSANGNDMFLNIWDANGSYTKAIGSTFSSFDASSSAAAGEFINLNLNTDAAFQAFITGRTSFSWDIIGVNRVGDSSSISTFTGSAPLTGAANPTVSTMATGGTNILNFMGAVNGGITSATTFAIDPITLLPTTTIVPNGITNGVDALYTTTNTAPTYVTANGAAAKGTFVSASLIAGSQANNSFASGVNLLKVAGIGTSTTRSVETLYSGVKAYIDTSNYSLHVGAVAAVPEPESLAMMLAGLGMVGSIVMRRSRKV